MAEANGDDENPFSFRNYNRKKESTTNDEDETLETFSSKSNIGIRGQHDSEKRGSDVPKREENPFSFKHFLKRDSSNNYQNTGARPKVYSNPASENLEHTESELELETNLYSRGGTPRHVGTPELTSVLPDFVQDHLVVEQCYLNHSDVPNTSQLAVDLENLPDFTINNISPVQELSSPHKSVHKSRQWEEPKSIPNDLVEKDIPFDLTGITINQNNSGRARKGSGPTPLDLPNDVDSFKLSNRSNGGLPFDLPCHDTDGTISSPVTSTARSGPMLGEVGVSKSLPDFLSDGPIHSGRHSDSESTENISVCSNGADRNHSSDEHVQRFQMDNERLRRELDISRRQLAEQARRIQILEKELCVLQTKEHEETANLEKAIEQVEDNLKRSTRRAVLAENQVSKLKQENKILLSELTQIRREHHDLRCGQGLAGSIEQSNEQLVQRLAHDLRSAAGSAESSLRVLLSGVENLRVIAATMESMHRIHDRTSDFLVDDGNNDPAGAGPAL